MSPPPLRCADSLVLPIPPCLHYSQGSVSMSKLSDNFFSLHMPSEYDYLMVSGKKCEIVTHIMNVYKETAGKALKVTFSNSFDYRIDSDNVREIHFTKVEGGVSTQIYTKSSKK
eukprot:TRINITY_DN4107_c0_g1_i3.p1 TRINITY_DN4107_c0_g1~~TRINITY_DN4107_c0_g1_i3.p1  ORF type:complete len:114 (+),score=13.17 TRINITY_DN4107_c0_g1_i3:385-726(+)